MLNIIQELDLQTAKEIICVHPNAIFTLNLLKEWFLSGAEIKCFGHKLSTNT